MCKRFDFWCTRVHQYSVRSVTLHSSNVKCEYSGPPPPNTTALGTGKTYITKKNIFATLAAILGGGGQWRAVLGGGGVNRGAVFRGTVISLFSSRAEMNRMQQRYTDLIQEEPGAVQTVNTGSCPCCGCCGEEVRARGFSSLGLGVQIFLRGGESQKLVLS